MQLYVPEISVDGGLRLNIGANKVLSPPRMSMERTASMTGERSVAVRAKSAADQGSGSAIDFRRLRPQPAEQRRASVEGLEHNQPQTLVGQSVSAGLGTQDRRQVQEETQLCIDASDKEQKTHGWERKEHEKEKEEEGEEEDGEGAISWLFDDPHLRERKGTPRSHTSCRKQFELSYCQGGGDGDRDGDDRDTLSALVRAPVVSYPSRPRGRPLRERVGQEHTSVSHSSSSSEFDAAVSERLADDVFPRSAIPVLEQSASRRPSRDSPAHDASANPVPMDTQHEPGCGAALVEFMTSCMHFENMASSLGVVFGNACGVEAAREEKWDSALSHFRRAAAEASPVALFNLALCYHHGRGVTLDHIKVRTYIYMMSACMRVSKYECIYVCLCI